jgi:PAS domain S-box-containing protein
VSQLSTLLLSVTRQVRGGNIVDLRSRLRMRSVRHKLFAGVLITSLAALLVTGVSMAIYDLHSYRLTWVNDLSTQAELIGRASVPALQFDDANLAHTNLSLLRVRPMIDAAALYNAKGALFARYIRDGIDRGVFPVLAEADGIRFDGENVVLNRRIVENNEIVGSIYLRAHYEFSQRLWNYVGILLAVSSLALVISLLLSSWLQANVTRPILAVTSLARAVVERRDYSLRATKTTEDEIGYMVDAFNGMLTEIARRTEAMEASNRNLEREMAERTGAEQALRDSEKRYRTLVATLTSVVWIANRSGEFVVEQPSWAAYTGQTEEQYRNAGWRRAFHTENRQLVERLWSQAENSKRALDCEAPLWHASSARYRIISLRALPVLDAEGKIQEWVGTVTDIDDRRRAEDEIRRLNAELEGRVQERTAQLQEANRELEAFSFSVSHDLRAPLRAIDGFSQVLLEDFGANVNQDMQGYLTRIRTATLRMGQLIEDLLNLSRISRLELVWQDVDLSAIARHVVSELRQRDPGRQVNVSVWDDVVARGDSRLLRIALENLLGNAWKFTSKTIEPLIEFGMTREGEKTVLFVRDNGAGFDMAHADKLFGAFQRLHGANEFPGTGIGLATVQRIMHRHDGRIWCHAQVGKGAMFFFTPGSEVNPDAKGVSAANESPEET